MPVVAVTTTSTTSARGIAAMAATGLLEPLGFDTFESIDQSVKKSWHEGHVYFAAPQPLEGMLRFNPMSRVFGGSVNINLPRGSVPAVILGELDGNNQLTRLSVAARGFIKTMSGAELKSMEATKAMTTAKNNSTVSSRTMRKAEDEVEDAYTKLSRTIRELLDDTLEEVAEVNLKPTDTPALRAAKLEELKEDVVDEVRENRRRVQQTGEEIREAKEALTEVKSEVVKGKAVGLMAPQVWGVASVVDEEDLDEFGDEVEEALEATGEAMEEVVDDIGEELDDVEDLGEVQEVDELIEEVRDEIREGRRLMREAKEEIREAGREADDLMLKADKAMIESTIDAEIKKGNLKIVNEMADMALDRASRSIAKVVEEARDLKKQGLLPNRLMRRIEEDLEEAFEELNEVVVEMRDDAQEEIDEAMRKSNGTLSQVELTELADDINEEMKESRRDVREAKEEIREAQDSMRDIRLEAAKTQLTEVVDERIENSSMTELDGSTLKGLQTVVQRVGDRVESVLDDKSVLQVLANEKCESAVEAIQLGASAECIPTAAKLAGDERGTLAVDVDPATGKLSWTSEALLSGELKHFINQFRLAQGTAVKRPSGERSIVVQIGNNKDTPITVRISPHTVESFTQPLTSPSGGRFVSITTPEAVDVTFAP